MKLEVDRADHMALMCKLLGMELKPGKLVRSPLREKYNSPSFNVYRGQDGKARWKDFAVEGGDIYHLVMYLTGCSFNEAIKKLADMLDLDAMIPFTPKRFVMPQKPPAHAAIGTVLRLWAPCDDNYWLDRYGISQTFATANGLYPCAYADILTADRQWRVNHSEDNPLYFYWINGHTKLYRPLHPDRKFRYMGNTTREDVFQAGYYGSDTPLLITAGQKDGLVASNELRCNTRAFNSESIIPTTEQMVDIMREASAVFVCYDNDEAGRKATQKMIDKHPTVTPIHLGMFTSLKDIADVRHGRAMSVLNSLKAIIHGQ